MRRNVKVWAALSLTLSLVLSPVRSMHAQPPGTTPPAVVPVITLRSVKIQEVSMKMRYERLGTRPTEFRASKDAAFTGAAWRPFTESNTTSTTSGTATVISGLLSWEGLPVVVTPSNCGENRVKIRIFLQMRRPNYLGRTLTSNIVGDSVCAQVQG